MLSYIVSFLVMLNPFALFLYLRPLMKELDNPSFVKVVFKASVISFFIFLVFVLSGSFIFSNLLKVDFEAFRIFGGVILFSIAFLFVVGGREAFVRLKEDLDDTATEISLPFMVGAGTISLSVLMSHELGHFRGFVSLGIIMFLNFLFIMGLKNFRDKLEYKKIKVVFDKNMEILLRLNGFFLGTIGVHMVLTAINNLYF
ncbi:MAG: MarC family protein [Nanoarchaeota archaeon]